MRLSMVLRLVAIGSVALVLLLVLSVSDARGITHTPAFQWDGAGLEVEPDAAPTGAGVES